MCEKDKYKTSACYNKLTSCRVSMLALARVIMIYLEELSVSVYIFYVVSLIIFILQNTVLFCNNSDMFIIVLFFLIWLLFVQ